MTASSDGTSRLWDTATGKQLVSLIAFNDGSWTVTDPEGRYDASSDNIDGLYWVVGLEPIELSQLKERYYEPGLLRKVWNGEPLRPVPAFDKAEVRLFPEVTGTKVEGDTLRIGLKNRGGGIGPVAVRVDGKEWTADARPKGFNPNVASATLTVDLSGLPRLPGKARKVEVFARNAEGYLSSRGVEVGLPPAEATAGPPPRLFGIVVGVSNYADPLNPKEPMDLRFAAKDAGDFASALTLAARGLFEDRADVRLLTSDATDDAKKATRANIERAFRDVAGKAGTGDVLVVYFAGHGVSFRPRGDSRDSADLYCYLTQDARTTDTTVLSDPAVRSTVCVTSDDLAAWTTGKAGVQALKQVIILDTCAAGNAAARLVEKRDVASEQVRALDRLKDRAGFHVLMGCAADRVSYEATRYGQGVLTYTLLLGLQGAALDGDSVDVQKLFQFAADRVPELAGSVGGVQRPQVAAPKGTSFPIGLMDTTARKNIVLPSPLPLVVRPRFLNPATVEDDLRLTVRVTSALRAESAKVARRDGSGSPTGGGRLVFVDADELPGAVTVTGVYSVENGAATVTLKLREDDKERTTRTVTGPAATEQDRDALAVNILEAVMDGLKN